MFAIGATIRLAAFEDSAFWWHIPPEVALWSAGVLFSLAVSEQTYFGSRLNPRVVPKEGGLGYSVDYDVTIPTQAGFTPKFIYLFLFVVAVWVLDLVLGGFAQKTFETGGFQTSVIVATAISYFLAAGAVAAAVRGLYEVT